MSIKTAPHRTYTTARATYPHPIFPSDPLACNIPNLHTRPSACTPPLHPGAYQPPASASAATTAHPLHAHMTMVDAAETAVEHLVEVVSGVAHEAAEVTRRLLQDGAAVYPPSPAPPVPSPPAPGIVYRTVDVVQIWPEGQVPAACNPATGDVNQGALPCALHAVPAVPAVAWCLCAPFLRSVAWPFVDLQNSQLTLLLLRPARQCAASPCSCAGGLPALLEERHRPRSGCP